MTFIFRLNKLIYSKLKCAEMSYILEINVKLAYAKAFMLLSTVYNYFRYATFVVKNFQQQEPYLSYFESFLCGIIIPYYLLPKSYYIASTTVIMVTFSEFSCLEAKQ